MQLAEITASRIISGERLTPEQSSPTSSLRDREKLSSHVKISSSVTYCTSGPGCCIALRTGVHPGAIAVTSLLPSCADPWSRLSSEGS